MPGIIFLGSNSGAGPGFSRRGNGDFGYIHAGLGSGFL